MKTKYYVFRELHNGETDGIDFQKPDSFDDINSAKKKFHNYLSTYIDYGKLDRVSVAIFDSFMNPVLKEVWSKPYVPEVVEPEETVTEIEGSV